MYTRQLGFAAQNVHNEVYCFDKNNAAEVRQNLLPWQRRGLRQTSSGYGKKLTTAYQVKVNKRWYRVYCCIFSNSGTLYICSKGKEIIVEID